MLSASYASRAEPFKALSESYASRVEPFKVLSESYASRAGPSKMLGLNPPRVAQDGPSQSEGDRQQPDLQDVRRRQAATLKGGHLKGRKRPSWESQQQRFRRKRPWRRSLPERRTDLPAVGNLAAGGASSAAFRSKGKARGARRMARKTKDPEALRLFLSFLPCLLSFLPRGGSPRRNVAQVKSSKR